MRSSNEKKVIPIRKTSEEAFNAWGKRKVGMILIDGYHLYEYVKYDIEHWSRVLKKEGILVLHDLDDGGVSKAVCECVLDRMKFIKRKGSLIAFVNEGKTGMLRKIKIMLHCKYRIFVCNHNKSWYVNLLRRIKFWLRNDVKQNLSS